MGKRPKKVQDLVKEWLLRFEENAGVPVVISLIVSDQEIRFLSCVNKAQYLSSEDETGEGAMSNPDDLAQTKLTLKESSLSKKIWEYIR